MSYSIEIDESRRLVTMIRGAEMDVEEVEASRARIAEAIRDKGVNRILIDGSRAVQAQSSAYTYESMSKAAQLYPPGIRMAAVVPPQLWDAAVFAAQVSNNRGLNFRLFADIESARTWLDE